jgi:hypothetical protein
VDPRGRRGGKKKKPPSGKLGTLSRRLAEITGEKPILVRSGARSAIAASILKAHGFSHVINLSGGYLSGKKKEGRSSDPIRRNRKKEPLEARLPSVQTK